MDLEHFLDIEHTMQETKAKKMVATKNNYNPDAIFSRVCYLMSTGHLEYEKLFHYELATLPTSLCNDFGEPRYTTSKADLKKHLKTTVTSRFVKFDSFDRWKCNAALSNSLAKRFCGKCTS